MYKSSYFSQRRLCGEGYILKTKFNLKFKFQNLIHKTKCKFLITGLLYKIYYKLKLNYKNLLDYKY